MKKNHVEKRFRFCLDLVPRINKILLNYFKKKNLDIQKKGSIDLVTEADTASESFLIKSILNNFKEDSILGEEKGERKGTSPYQWIIDPLDGTTNFSHKIPLFAVSIALFDLETNQVLFGVVSLPAFGDVYSALIGKGAKRNKQKIFVSKTNKMIDALFCTGFPYKKSLDDVDRMLSQLKPILLNTRGVRRTGAAALDLCWVAEGKFDGFWEESLCPWDMAAGARIILEAGGEVTTFSGNPFHPNIPNILATNKILHKRALQDFIPDSFLTMY